MQNGANVSIKGAGGCPPLTFAALRGLTYIGKYLLDNGAEIEQRADREETALMWASKRGHLPMVKFLLDKVG